MTPASITENNSHPTCGNRYPVQDRASPRRVALTPKVVGQIWTHYGEAQVDFYASRETIHGQEWYSLIVQEDCSGLGVLFISRMANRIVVCFSAFFHLFLKSFRGSGRVITLCWWWHHAGQEGQANDQLLGRPPLISKFPKGACVQTVLCGHRVRTSCIELSH